MDNFYGGLSKSLETVENLQSEDCLLSYTGHAISDTHTILILRNISRFAKPQTREYINISSGRLCLVRSVTIIFFA